MSKAKADSYTNQRECRLRKAEGYSDEELKCMGFDAATISRSVVSIGGNRGSAVSTKRCKQCGAKCYHLDRSGDCYACTLTEKLAREGKSEPVKEVTGIRDPWKTLDHPAIIKTKS